MFIVSAAANDVTKQKDLSRFHRHLLNRLDCGAEEEKPREEEPTTSQRRTLGERSSNHSERERERERRERDRDRRRSESGSGEGERQRERRRSGEERRRSRHHSDRSNEGENPIIPQVVENKNGEQQVQEEMAETERIEKERGEERMEGGEEQTSFVDDEGLKLPSELTQEDKEERRKVAAAKRTDSQAQLSAKERYLARKRARTSAPVITKDD